MHCFLNNKACSLSLNLFLFFLFIGNCYAQVNENGLVMHLKFDGNGNDASGYNNNGTLFNTLDTTDRLDQSRKALFFDGSSTYVLVKDDSSIDPEDGITVSAWYRTTAFEGSGNDPIVDKPFYTHTAPYYQYHMGVSGNSYSSSHSSFGFSVAINGNFENVSTGNNVYELDTWYYIVGTYNGTYLRIYVNGVLYGQRVLTGKLQTFDTDLLIGKYGNSTYHLPGTIDDVKIYTRALTPGEVVDHFNYDVDKFKNFSFTSSGNCTGSIVDFTYSGYQGFDSIQWSFGDGIVSGEINPIHTYSASGIYNVNLVVWHNNNSYKQTKTLTIYTAPYLKLPTDTVICYGENLNLNIGGNDYSYLWSDGSTSPTYTITETGKYWVKISNVCGSASDTINVGMKSLKSITFPGDTSVCQNSIFRLNVVGPDEYTYTWTNGQSGKSFETIITSNLDIGLAVSDNGVCKDVYISKVIAEECADRIIIPNVFTPNGDGKNDYWVIENLDEYPNCSVEVFNRWGMIVYSSKGYLYPWDGTYNGEKVSSGCYYYVIILNNGSGAFTGPLMIYY